MRKAMRWLVQTICMVALLAFTSLAAAAPVSSPYSTLPPSPVQGGVFQRGDEAMPVILDADMVDLFDDGVAMMMLAKSPRIDLLGVTICIGNSWAEDGVASAIRQLEGIKRTDIPVFQGVNRTIRKNRYKNMEKERKMFGWGKETYMGSVSYPQPKSWLDAYRERFKEEPSVMPQKEHAVDYLIRTIKARPHEVTVIAIGTGANMAAALKKAPEIAPLIKRIIYMGGAFYHEGNSTPLAEFNYWIDPEAAKIMIRAPYPDQIFLPLDVCEKVTIDYKDFLELEKRIKNPLFKSMWENHYMVGLFRKDPEHYTNYIWDVLAAAVAIDPTLVQEEYYQFVDVNDVYSPCYGKTIAFIGEPPVGTQKAHIVQTIDRERLWPMILEVFDEL